MKLYIEVKAVPGRVRAESKGRGRRYFPYDYSLDTGANLRAAAYAYAQILLNAAGYAIDTPVLTEYVSVKTGLPIGYAWEG